MDTKTAKSYTQTAARVLFALADQYHKSHDQAHVDSVHVTASGQSFVSVTLANGQPREYPAHVSRNLVTYNGRFQFFGLKDEDLITAIEAYEGPTTD